MGREAHEGRRAAQGEGRRAGKGIDPDTTTKGNSMSALQSDVKWLEQTVRLEPLEETPLNALIDLLQESGRTRAQARRRAGDVRREGLRRLLDSNTRLMRRAHDELRRTADHGPIDEHVPLCVLLWVRGWVGEDTQYFSDTTGEYKVFLRVTDVLRAGPPSCRCWRAADGRWRSSNSA